MKTNTSDCKHTEFDFRINGTFTARFLLELFRNSGYFAIVNILLESLVESPLAYAKEPDLYAIIGAVLIQAYWLSRWNQLPKKRKFLGNLIGPAIYTCFEVAIEGTTFFLAPHHQAYWIFSLFIGGMQYLSVHERFAPIRSAVIILENTVRSLLVFIMYMVLEWHLKGGIHDWIQFITGDKTHIYLLLSTLFLGMGIGTAEVVGERYLSLLKQTSRELRSYSEWLFGRKLLKKVMDKPDLLKLRNVERVVLFMDIRGFTRWSETTTPEEVVKMLNSYFSLSEKIMDDHDVIKVKFTGDEVLAVFDDAGSAVAAALKVQQQVRILLAPIGVGVGIGINAGTLMEGIIGADNIRYYDVIGDTVNTGKRIEGNAAAGEILVSESVHLLVSNRGFSFGEKRRITVKGKQEPLLLYPVQEMG